jgi:hypothetical protein
VYVERTRVGASNWSYVKRAGAEWARSSRIQSRHLTSATARRKTACHELGHLFGLDHRRTGRTCMRDGFATRPLQPGASLLGGGQEPGDARCGEPTAHQDDQHRDRQVRPGDYPPSTAMPTPKTSSTQAATIYNGYTRCV